MAYTADSDVRLLGPGLGQRIMGGLLSKLNAHGHHWSIAFSHDGRTLAGGTVEVNKVNLWDVTSYRLAR